MIKAIFDLGFFFKHNFQCHTSKKTFCKTTKYKITISKHYKETTDVAKASKKITRKMSNRFINDSTQKTFSVFNLK